MLARGMARASEAGVPARAEIARGRRAGRALGAGHRGRARMIVVGPTPHRLISVAPVPVLSVPAPEARLSHPWRRFRSAGSACSSRRTRSSEDWVTRFNAHLAALEAPPAVLA